MSKHNRYNVFDIMSSQLDGVGKFVLVACKLAEEIFCIEAMRKICTVDPPQIQSIYAAVDEHTQKVHIRYLNSASETEVKTVHLSDWDPMLRIKSKGEVNAMDCLLQICVKYSRTSFM